MSQKAMFDISFKKKHHKTKLIHFQIDVSEKFQEQLAHCLLSQINVMSQN